jgi:HEAT repeat protein
MSRSTVIVPALLLLVAGLGCAGDIVEHERAPAYTPEALHAALTAGDFRAKNRARAQLEALPPQERLALLLEVSASPDPATRILAVVELGKVGESGRPALEALAAGDPDADVRELAGMLLEGDDGDDGDDDE